MSDAAPTKLWVMQATYVALSLTVIFFQLLPLETIPRRWTGPDVLVLIGFAWALRRPDFLPAYLVAFVALMADLMFQRPPGLMAAILVIATETLKRRSRLLRDQGFAVEWLTVASALLAVMLSYRLILSIMVVPHPPLGLTLIQLVMSVMCYPLIAALSHYLFGVRRVAPGEVDAWGHKL